MNKRAKNLIERFAAEEDSFRSRQFLAPAVPGGSIHVRLGDVVCKLKVAPDDYLGFGIFETISFTEAILVRDASLLERKTYLDALPKVSLIAAKRTGRTWLAATAVRGDKRFRIDGLVPVRLAENVDLFDTIECRFDGNAFWFDRTSTRANPRDARALRKALLEELAPTEIKISGLSAEHRAVYEMQYRLAVEPETKEGARVEARGNHSDLHQVQKSLSHAGARLVGVREQDEILQVSFTVDGRDFTSAVHRENLGLISAGICLDGYDEEFDLTSLVSVLREGITTRQV